MSSLCFHAAGISRSEMSGRPASLFWSWSGLTFEEDCDVSFLALLISAYLPRFDSWSLQSLDSSPTCILLRLVLLHSRSRSHYSITESRMNDPTHLFQLQRDVPFDSRKKYEGRRDAIDYWQQPTPLHDLWHSMISASTHTAARCSGLTMRLTLIVSDAARRTRLALRAWSRCSWLSGSE